MREQPSGRPRTEPDRAVAKAFVEAEKAVDAAHRAADPLLLRRAQELWVPAAQAWADDLERCGTRAPDGLRDRIEAVRARGR